MTSDILERSKSDDIANTHSTGSMADGDAPDVKATSFGQRDPDTHAASPRPELSHMGRRGSSWIETLRAAQAQPPLSVEVGVARRLARAAIPEAIVARLPADFQADPWITKLVSLPGVTHAGHEYVSTKMVFIALGERGNDNKAARLARLMRALGWERCKLYPHLGFGRKVVRGFRKQIAPAPAMP